MPCFPVSFGTFQMYGLNLPAIPPMDMQQKRIMKLCVNWKGMSHLLRTYPEEFPNLPAGRLADKLAAPAADVQKHNWRISDDRK